VYNHNKYNLDLSSHPLTAIGDDIKHCQLIDVPVSLSIGGFGTGYSLRSSREAALELFDHLWNAYNGRPAGEAAAPDGDTALCVSGIWVFCICGANTDDRSKPFILDCAANVQYCSNTVYSTAALVRSAPSDQIKFMTL
jgi:chitinase